MAGLVALNCELARLGLTKVLPPTSGRLKDLRPHGAQLSTEYSS